MYLLASLATRENDTYMGTAMRLNYRMGAHCRVEYVGAHAAYGQSWPIS